MIVSDLSAADVRRALEQSGLRVRIGPFVAQVKSAFETLQAAMILHYAAHDVVSRDEFADFHVSVRPPAGIRRWIRQQAVFRFENNPPFKPLAASQAFPMFEWGLNWCISSHCHQYLIIHAAVVSRDGRALILPAPPGSGKSTLCAALVARGWRLLSDELTLIDAASGDIIPIPRPISLKNDSIGIVAQFSPGGAMTPIVYDTSKGSIAHLSPPPESVRDASRPARPGWIVLVRYQRDAPTRLSPLSKGSALMQLARNAFNYSMHGFRGFELLASIVAASGCHEFSYGGSLDDAVRVFDGMASGP